MRPWALVLAPVLTLSLLARWPIASHDLEHYIGPDEGEVVENVLEMVKTGDFDHRHPGYPGLHFHLQRISAELQLLFSGRSVASIPREDFYLAARRMTLLAGVATAAVVFAAGLRFLAPREAALASTLVALSPLAFRESAVVNPDLMLGLAVAISLLFDLRLRESPTPARHLAAGVAVGLASAVKYTGALTVVPFLAASLLPRARAPRWILGGMAAAFAAFALASPYTFLNLREGLAGVGAHVDYYRASQSHAGLELVRILSTRGLSIVGVVLSLAGIILALWTREPRRLVVAAFPLAYLLLFSLFDRAYPRHVLPVLPPLSLLAADAAGRVRGRLFAALAFAVLAGPALGSGQLFLRSLEPSAADLAESWALTAIPEGSRVLQDQWTPRLDQERFRVHRIRVEEKVFPGSFDWVFVSGYPPGIDVRGLREVRRFENPEGLGSAITVYQVPDRASLMGTTLAAGTTTIELGAGEPRYFGEGFHPPRPTAYGTALPSRGKSSEIFFVLPEMPEREDPPDLALALTLGAAIEGIDVRVEVELNGAPAGSVHVESLEPETMTVRVPERLSRSGLNRLVLRYGGTSRLDRRHRETAVRFYRLRLTRY